MLGLFLDLQIGWWFTNGLYTVDVLFEQSMDSRLTQIKLQLRAGYEAAPHGSSAVPKKAAEPKNLGSSLNNGSVIHAGVGQCSFPSLTLNIYQLIPPFFGKSFCEISGHGLCSCNKIHFVNDIRHWPSLRASFACSLEKASFSAPPHYLPTFNLIAFVPFPLASSLCSILFFLAMGPWCSRRSGDLYRQQWCERRMLSQSDRFVYDRPA